MDVEQILYEREYPKRFISFMVCSGQVLIFNKQKRYVS
ncbi:hypothetical protein EHF_0614 [Ehrlichia japonica]|uniref:Uncharacterized protein n=1 Tax=Ehrlichia japonica TaxID=391036 RepID=X5H2H2_9RICK|nr:hypothetical protein EHF_0614 [Ehrlichia japonica]